MLAIVRASDVWWMVATCLVGFVFAWPLQLEWLERTRGSFQNDGALGCNGKYVYNICVFESIATEWQHKSYDVLGCAADLLPGSSN